MTDTASEVSACTLHLTRERALWLAQLDSDPAALLQHLSLRPSHRLGVYFEQLWHFFLQHDTDTQLVAHNIAVHEAGRTIGEFDCIYFSRQRGCHVHLELAVKFFLGLPRADDCNTVPTSHEWLGPDQRDRLETKLDQLLQRQIRLGDATPAKRKLAELGIPEPSREIALKGYLFQPLHHAPPPPPAYNADCTMSYWITCDQLPAHCATLDTNSFMILPKMAWLSAAQFPQTGHALDQPQLLQQVTAHLAGDHYPLLIAALDERCMESSRFFVTRSAWPDNSNQ